MKQKLSIAFSMAIILAMLLATGVLAFTTTDQPDYAPNSVVTISGDGSQMQNGQLPYVDEALVTVVVTGPHGPYDANNNPLGYSSTCTAIVGAADPNDPNAVATSGAWSCQVMLSENPDIALGLYTYTATSLAADGITQIYEAGTFTDATTITTATIATYDSWPCLTGKTDFIRGDTVVDCVSITGVGGAGQAGNFSIVWFNPSNVLVDAKTFTVPPSNQLPASYTGSYYSSALSPTGTWTVKVCKNASCSGTGNTVASATFTLNVGKLNQTITITTPAPATAVYNTSFTVAATASSGLPVTYSSGSPLICSNVGAAFTMLIGTGTCVVQYDQAGNGTYNAAPQETSNTTAGKANQTITVDASAPATAVYNTSFTVAATASSGLAVAYSSGSPLICSNVGALFTMLSGTGTCVVQYDQAGDDNYNPATQVTENVTAQKANQTITVDTSAPATAVYNTSFTVSATASSGLIVAYSPSGVCTNVGATFTMTSGTGTCTVLYDQAGDTNYSAAPQVTATVTAQLAGQTITVTTPAPASAVFGASFTVSATATSGLPVAYSASGVCTNVGATFTMTSGTGTCTVLYDQAGDTNYSAAPQVTETVTAQLANTTTSLTSSANPSVVGASVTFTATVAPSAATGMVQFYADGNPLGSAAALSGGTASVSTALLSVGTHVITGTYSGDSNFNASTSAPLEQIVSAACVSVTGADFNFTPSAPRVGQPVNFTAVITGGTAPIAYTWNFGHGADVITTTASIVHSFPLTTTIQTYLVTLTAANACSSQPATPKSVTVRPYGIYLPVNFR